MVEIAVVETPTLGDRSYLVSDGAVAFVVDPQRDIDRMLTLAGERGVRIVDVFETHLHNDYLTGGLALARATGAAYHVAGADAVSFERSPVANGDVVTVGDAMCLRAVATPGHTHTHLSYVLTAPGRAPAVFTGGSLLYGSTGRPDLLGADHTETLAHEQYSSARRLAAELPDETEIYPTHGFGSFCSATQARGDSSTIGREKQHNPALTRSESDYVRELLTGLDDYPAYYVHMQPLNAAGPAAAELGTPARAEPAEIRGRIEDGEWVVDLRNRTAFAAGHVPGAVNVGLEGSLATYLGWLVPWESSVTLLGETPQQVADAQRELARIGLDRIAAQATGRAEDWTDGAGLASLPLADFTDLAAVRHHRPVAVLDVRRGQEWNAGHLPEATPIPLHELLDRLDEVPCGEVWVHCQSGYRAAIAASILAAAGRQVVAIDDHYDNARATHEALATAADATG
jgi:glyoxylase-like metal-dependent hydrolase (beta-lactamase superfamily II)/rhodanese-related sulfurtransferase